MIEKGSPTRTDVLSFYTVSYQEIIIIVKNKFSKYMHFLAVYCKQMLLDKMIKSSTYYTFFYIMLNIGTESGF